MWTKRKFIVLHIKEMHFTDKFIITFDGIRMGRQQIVACQTISSSSSRDTSRSPGSAPTTSAKISRPKWWMTTRCLIWQINATSEKNHITQTSVCLDAVVAILRIEVARICKVDVDQASRQSTYKIYICLWAMTYNLSNFFNWILYETGSNVGDCCTLACGFAGFLLRYVRVNDVLNSCFGRYL